jgi:hypothetical protein
LDFVSNIIAIDLSRVEIHEEGALKISSDFVEHLYLSYHPIRDTVADILETATLKTLVLNNYGITSRARG